MCRLLLVDDDPSMRATLRSIAAATGHEIAGEAENGRLALEAASRLQPDVVLLDIFIPVMDGLTAAREIRKQFPATQLIFVSQNADKTCVQEAFRSGAAGYVLKQAARTELPEALAAVERGSLFRSHQIPV